MPFFRKLLSVVSLSAFAIPAALGQTLPQSVVDCAAQKKDSARLACFDREVARITQPSQSVVSTPKVSPPAVSPTAPVADSIQKKTATKEDDFGANSELLRKRNEESKNPDVPLQELHAAVKKVTKKLYGELVMELDNGQVWEQPEPKDSFVIKANEAVVITQNKLGSSFLTAGSGSTTRVRRVR